MTQTGVARRPSSKLKRTAKQLHPLIVREFKLAIEAGAAHWMAGGQMMLEAKADIIGKPAGARRWGVYQRSIADDVGVHLSTVYRWTKSAEAHNKQQVKSSVRRRLDWTRGQHKSQAELIGDNASRPRPPAWLNDVKRVVETVDTERLAVDHLAKRNEARALKDLALRLVDIGFKVLAKELHPDKKAGSAEAMTRLTTVKRALKNSVEHGRPVHFD